MDRKNTCESLLRGPALLRRQNTSDAVKDDVAMVNALVRANW